MQKLKHMIALLLKLLRMDSKSKQPIYSKQPQLISWRSCDTLPIKVFYEILNSGDLSPLSSKSSEAQEIWSNILEEYWKLSDELKYSQNIAKLVSILRTKNQINTLLGAVYLYEMGDPLSLDTFKYFGIDGKENAIKKINTLKNQLAVKLAQATEEVKKDVKYNLYKDAVQVEQILGRSFDLDKTTVTYWIELNKMAKLIIKERNGRNK